MLKNKFQKYKGLFDNIKEINRNQQQITINFSTQIILI